MSEIPVFWREDFESLPKEHLVEMAFQMQAYILTLNEQIEVMDSIIVELKAANEILRGMF